MKTIAYSHQTLTPIKTICLLIFAVMTVLFFFNCSPPGGGGGGPTQVATPVISPGDTTDFEQDTPVTITCATAGVSIYYTTDDVTDPTTASTPYTGPIPADTFAEGVGVNVTIRAIGILAGSTDSEIDQAVYTNVVDTLGPIPVMSSAYDTYGIVPIPFTLTITFNENVTGFDENDITVTSGNATVGATAGGPRIYTSLITPDTDDTTVTIDINAAVCQDGATAPNDNQAATQFSIFYNEDAPIGMITSAASDPTDTSPIAISIDFGIDVTGFDAGDLTLGNGSAGNFAGGPQVYTADITPTADGAVTVDIAGGACTAVSDGTPNIPSTQFSRVFDSTAPTVAINQAAGQDDPCNGTINFTAIFSEPVSGFATGDVSFTGSTASGTLVDTVTEIAPNDGTTYNVAVTGMTGDGTVIASIAAAVATDAVGHDNEASSSTDNSVTYDGTSPNVSIEEQVVTEPTTTSPIAYLVVFTEPVTGFITGDVTLSGTADATTATVAEIAPNDGTTYSVAVSGMTADGTVIASLAAGVATDAAGNSSKASTSTDNTVAYDGFGPSVAVEKALGQSDPANVGPINFTVVFSESVANFITGDVTLSGTAGADTAIVTEIAPNNGTTYNVAVTGMTVDGTVEASIAAGVATDTYGHANTDSSSIDNSVHYDLTVPNVTSITSTTSATTGAYPIPVTIVFSEAIDPATFVEGDIAVTGTAGAAVQGGSLATTDNITWTLNLTASLAGSISVTVNAAVCQDFMGYDNTNAGLVTLARTYVTTIPYRNEVSVRGNTATVTTPTLNHQGGTFILVQVVWEATSNITITSGVPTFDGNDCTAIPGAYYAYTNGTNYWLKMQSFYYLNPSNNRAASVTFSADPTEAKVAAISYQNVDQTNPSVQVVTQDAGATGALYGLSTVVTTTSYWSSLHDLYAGSDNSTSTAAGGSTKSWSQDTDNAISGAGYKQTTTPGANTMQWTIASAQVTRLIHEIIELRIVQ
jgi:hypothetical protein